MKTYRTNWIQYLLIMLVCGTSQHAASQTYTSLIPDSTFQTVGYTIIDLVEGRESIKKSLLLPDGSWILATSVSTEVVTNETRIYHFFANGNRDKSFNNGIGYYSYNFLVENIPTDIIIDQQGKILLLIQMKYNSNTDSYPILVKLNVDGTIDTSYGNNGVTSISLTKELRLVGMAKTVDGYIYIAGVYRYNDQQFNSLIVRLTPIGTPDQNFGGANSSHSPAVPGVKGIDYIINEEKEETSVNIILEKTGRLLLVGNHNAAPFGSNRSYMLISYLPNTQSKDYTYGFEGKSYFNLGTSNGDFDWITKGITDNKGNALVICQYRTLDKIPNRMSLARVTPKGRLDSTFNKTGTWVSTLIAKTSMISKIQVDSKNNIWATGYIQTPSGTNKAFVMRMKDDSSLDSSFCDNGMYYLNMIPEGTAMDFSLQNDKIMVFGNSDNVSSTSKTKTFIASFKILDETIEKPTTQLQRITINNECGKSAISIAFTSNSSGAISWDVASGPATKTGDSLYLKDVEGDIFIHLTQKAKGRYKALDSTFKLALENIKPVVQLQGIETRQLDCSKLGIALTFSSSSCGKTNWMVTSGPGARIGDSLFVTGRGDILIRFLQDKKGKFRAADSTFELQANCAILVYQYITPNNDGFNDKFHVQNIEFYPNSKVTIINKWQEEVFTSQGYKNTWQPSHLQEGTYYYVVQTNDGDEIHKGTLLLENK